MISEENMQALSQHNWSFCMAEVFKKVHIKELFKWQLDHITNYYKKLAKEKKQKQKQKKEKEQAHKKAKRDNTQKEKEKAEKNAEKVKKKAKKK